MKRTVFTYKIAILATVLLIAAGAVTASAQEPVVGNDSGVDARGMGMGGAQIAAVNGLSAMVYNPAALARLKNIEFQLGLNMLKRKIDTTLSSSRGTGTSDALTDYSGLGSLGFAYPVPTQRGSLVFGIGINRVKDFAGRMTLDGYNDYLRGTQTGESLEEGGMSIASFAGAVDVSPNVSIGASLDVWFGDYTRSNRNVINDPSETYSQIDIDGLESDISAWSFKPAILYHTEKFRLGAFVRLPMTFHISEKSWYEWSVRTDGYYYGLHDIPDPSLEYDGADGIDKLNYEIKAPMQLGLGFMWGTPGYRSFAVDVTHENWSQAKITYPADYLPEPNYFRDKYRSVLSWSVGGEIPIPVLDVVARAGYMRRPLAFKGPRGYDSGNPPITVSNEQDFFTLGLGKQLDKSVSVDVAYTRGIWTQEESPREETEETNRLYLSLTYRMPIQF